MERIYACNHPSISPSNKDQLQVHACLVSHSSPLSHCPGLPWHFAGLLLKARKRPPPSGPPDVGQAGLVRYGFLCAQCSPGIPFPGYSPLINLAKLDAQNAATLFQQTLTIEYQKWSRNRRSYPPFSTVSCAPSLLASPLPASFSLLQLLLFQLTSAVFPASDYRHPVTTPTFQFMCQILAQVSEGDV